MINILAFIKISIMKIFTLLFCLFFARSATAVIQKLPEKQPRKVIILTIPKSGSHLLEKAVKEITDRFVDMLPYDTLWKLGRGQELAIDEDIHWTHLYKETNRLKDVDPEKYIRIINVRDPRDILLSQIGWADRLRNWASWTPPKFFDFYHTLSQEDKLSFCIYFPHKYDSVKEFCNRALEWMKDPHVLVCRFEDLVGPKGGGDKAVQEKAIKDLANHLGYDLDQLDIESVANNLFGDTETFNKGQIGRWKEVYSEKHKAQFNEVLGEELIKLGYEQDLNW